MLFFILFDMVLLVIVIVRFMKLIFVRIVVVVLFRVRLDMFILIVLIGVELLMINILELLLVLMVNSVWFGFLIEIELSNLSGFEIRFNVLLIELLKLIWFVLAFLLVLIMV